MNFKAVIATPADQILNAFTFWVVLNLIWFGVFGYAIYWFFGASTSVYADLRADVDGTEEDEIYLEDEEDDFDAFQEAVDAARPEVTEPSPAETKPTGDSATPDTPDAPDAPETDAGSAEKPKDGDA